MSAPKRIQMSRRIPWRADNPDAVIVARPSKWGNPMRVGETRIRIPARDGSEYEFEGRLHKTVGGRFPFYGKDRTTWHDIALATTQQCVDMYRAYLTGGGAPYRDTDFPTRDESPRVRAELAGKDLACWCPLDQPCHADVLLEIANGGDQS